MNHCYIIAEAGVNHNGDVGLAVELLKKARLCGADAVKFQSFKTEKLVRQRTRTAEYQRVNTGEADQFAMLKKLELSETAWMALRQESQALAGIELLSSPFDEESARILIESGMKRIKVPSGEITNHPFLEFLAMQDLPLILSTGMATLEEVKEAVGVVCTVRQQLGLLRPLAEIVTVLHCTSNYPTELEDVNLRAMVTLRESLSLPTGYSDHTDGDTVALAAVAMGAVVVEKHFTLDRSLPGPDHKASLEPEAFGAMVARIREVERALGDGIKMPRASEEAVRDLVRRSAVVARNLPSAHQMAMSDIVFLRPGFGISPRDAKQLVGRVLSRPKMAGEVLSWTDFVR